MHVVGQRITERNGVRRKSAAPVPLNGDSFSNRFAAMGYTGDPHVISVRSLKGRDDRHAMADLGQSEQCVRCATFQHDVGPDVRKAASGVEQPPDRIAGVEQ